MQNESIEIVMYIKSIPLISSQPTGGREFLGSWLHLAAPAEDRSPAVDTDPARSIAGVRLPASHTSAPRLDYEVPKVPILTIPYSDVNCPFP